MITMPKMIAASGHECVVASVTMVCMYWRQTKQTLSWNIPLDFDHKEWSNFYEKGLKYVRRSGMPINNLKHFLRILDLPLDARLEFLEDAYGLRKLISLNIPPIALYDRNYFFKHMHGIGHAVILVDQTEEMFVSVDPSLGPKYISRLAKTDFLEAWKFTENATVIISPKYFRIEEIKIPSVTLIDYLSNGGQTR